MLVLKSKLRDHKGVVHIAAKPGTFGTLYAFCEWPEVRYGIDELREVAPRAVVTCLACLGRQ